jgi:hypothetical protein
MRSIQDVSKIATVGTKFSCPKSNSDLFTIMSVEYGMFVVDYQGNVIDPAGTPLNYKLTDNMTCNECGLVSTVRNFLTVDPFMDSPQARVF